MLDDLVFNARGELSPDVFTRTTRIFPTQMDLLEESVDLPLVQISEDIDDVNQNTMYSRRIRLDFPSKGDAGAITSDSPIAHPAVDEHVPCSGPDLGYMIPDVAAVDDHERGNSPSSRVYPPLISIDATTHSSNPGWTRLENPGSDQSFLEHHDQFQPRHNMRSGCGPYRSEVEGCNDQQSIRLEKTPSSRPARSSKHEQLVIKCRRKERKHPSRGSKATQVIRGMQELYSFGVSFGLLEKSRVVERYHKEMENKFRGMVAGTPQQKMVECEDSDGSYDSTSSSEGSIVSNFL